MLTFRLSEKDFEYYNICLNKWTVEGGSYSIMVGASSEDIRLKHSVEIKGTDDYSVNKAPTRFAMLNIQ